MNLEDIIKNRKVADNGDDIEYTPAATKDLSHIDTFLKVISNNNRLNITYSNEARVGYYTPALNEVVLPYYITKDRDVYILMGSHEISHVLHTPLEFLDNHDGTNSNKHPTVRGVKFNKVLMNCINIVEDIRIERLIRNKFPGFVAVYERGYTKLFHTLFNMAEDSWDNMHLGDRINHKAKLGKLSKHQLTTYEEGIFRYLKDTKDFNDVIIKSLYLYNILMENEKPNDKEQEEQAEDECEAKGDNKNTDPDVEDNNPKDSDEPADGSSNDSKGNSEETEDNKDSGETDDNKDSSTTEDKDSGEMDKDGSDSGEESIEDIISKLEKTFGETSSDDFSEDLLQKIVDIVDKMGELDEESMERLSTNTLDNAKDEYIDNNINAGQLNFNPGKIEKYDKVVNNPRLIMNKIF